MERIISVNGVKVTQVVGNIRTPDDGDWHFEWKAGAPHWRFAANTCVGSSPPKRGLV